MTKTLDPQARPETPALKSMRHHLWMALGLIVLFGGTAVAWAALSEVDSAVVATGTVVVETTVKRIQHPTGGVIGEIDVKEGQSVKKGDILVRFDDTATRANLGIVINELSALRATFARLTAEQEGVSSVTFPNDLVARAKAEPGMEQILNGESRLFASGMAMRASQKSQLEERVKQLREEITGLQDQKKSTETVLRVAHEELKSLETLRKQGLIAHSRLTALEREIAEREGALGEQTARIAQSYGKITETEFQILQQDKDASTEVSKSLRETETKIGELNERRIAAEEELIRVDVRAPIAGTVHQLSVHTIGGVVASSEPLMLLVPDADKLVIEVQMAPHDIDQVQIGQPVRVKFAAFNRRTTPEVLGALTRISGDIIREQQTGRSYYTGTVVVSDVEMKKLDGLKLLPGMSAEVYIKTGHRTPLSYLIKPFTDEMEGAMRER